jgi:flagellar motor switch protein FliN/FliY
MANETPPNQPDLGLSQADIDAALAAAGTDQSSSGSEPSLAEVNAAVEAVLQSTSSTTASADLGVRQADIDAALAGLDATVTTASVATRRASPPSSDTRVDSSGRPFHDAAAAMAEAIAAEKAAAVSQVPAQNSAIRAAPIDLPDFGTNGHPSKSRGSIDLLKDVEMHVTIELGRARMNVEDVLRLGEGSIVELDKLAGDPVDVLVNDRLVARGEVLILNDAFSVRINEIFGSSHQLAAEAGGVA